MNSEKPLITAQKWPFVTIIPSSIPWLYGVLFLLSMFVTACNSAQDEAAQFFLKGNVQLQKQEYREAIRFYTEAIEKKHDFADAYNNRGLASYRNGNPEAALADYSKAITIDPEFGAAYLNRADVLLESGDATGSLNDLMRIEKTYRDSTFFQSRLGDVYLRLNKLTDAQVAYDKAIQLDASNVEALTNRAALFYQQKAYALASQDIDQALQRNPNQPEALNNKALLLAQQGKYAEALPFVDRALNTQTGQPYYLNNKAYLLLMLNQNDEALPLLQESLRRDAQNAWAHRNLGIYHLRQSQPVKAIEALKQAEKLDASVDGLYGYLGQAYQQAGDQPNACATWKRGALAGDELARQAVARYCPGS